MYGYDEVQWVFCENTSQYNFQCRKFSTRSDQGLKVLGDNSLPTELEQTHSEAKQYCMYKQNWMFLNFCNVASRQNLVTVLMLKKYIDTDS